MGLHIARLILAHGIMKFRMIYLSGGVPKLLRKQYYEDVLSKEDFQDLYHETREIKSEIRECIQGNTLTHRIHLDKDNFNQSKVIQDLITRKDIVKLLKFGAGKNHLPVSHIQVIKSNYVKGKGDPQKNLHSDTFHPTMKYWFFLQDVGHNMAPFTYIIGSNKLTWKRLKWEYEKSIHMDEEQASYAKNGSFRIEEEELEVLGLPLPTEVCVSKNTLVIVNTFGFHRRGDSNIKSTRSEIWGISRTNPFNPFVGFGLTLFHKLDNWGLKKLRLIKDKEALKRGGISSWHVIKSRNLYDDSI